MSPDNRVPSATRTIEASEFKANCLKLMDEVAASGQEIVITKHGRPVARLAPIRERPNAPFGSYRGEIRNLGDIVSPMPADWFEEPKTWFGADRDKLEILGDIISPIDVEWEAEQGFVDGEERSS